MENKKKNPLDELFRRKLNEDQLAPDDLLWSEIEAKLEDKKPNRRFGLWFLLCAVLLFGVVGSYFAFFNIHSDNQLAIFEKVAPTENKKSGNEPPFNSTTESNHSVPANNSSTINSSSNTPDSKSNSITVNKNSTAEQNNSSIGNQTTDTKNSSPGNQATIIKNSSSGNLSASNKTIGKPIEKKSSNEIKKNENASIPHSNSTNDSKTEIDNSQKENSNSQLNSKNETGNSVSENTPSSSTTGDHSNDSITKNQNTNTINNEISATNENETLPDSAAVINTGGTPESISANPITKEKKSKWFIEAGSSYMKNTPALGFHGAYINPIEYQIDTLYYIARYKNEKSTYTFNYNFHVGMNIKNFQFETGMDVMRFGENIQYDNQGLCFTIEGNPTIGYDTLQVHTQLNNGISSRNGKAVNTYIGIPLQINYSIPLKILKLQFGVGGFASTPVKWNSYYLNKNITGLENPFALKMINTLVLGYSLNAGVAVPVTKQVDLELGCFQRRTMSPIEKSEYGTKKVFKTTGANISIRYNFINR